MRRDREEITLQPRKFRLLEFLPRGEGRVATREMLLEKVWDFHSDNRPGPRIEIATAPDP